MIESVGGRREFGRLVVNRMKLLVAVVDRLLRIALIVVLVDIVVDMQHRLLVVATK